MSPTNIFFMVERCKLIEKKKQNNFYYKIGNAFEILCLKL